MGQKSENHFRRETHRIPLPLLAVVTAVILLAASTGSVLAYLSLTTEETKNTFVPAKAPSLAIAETFDGTEKKNVSIEVNAPGYSVYVRAAIVVTWKDADGNVWNIAPDAATDYLLTLGDPWQKASDGFYYYPLPVYPGETLPELIQSCTLRENVTPPPGYDLNVEILSQTVQAPGYTDSSSTPAVTDAWNIAVGENGRLIIS